MQCQRHRSLVNMWKKMNAVKRLTQICPENDSQNGLHVRGIPFEEDSITEDMLTSRDEDGEP